MWSPAVRASDGLLLVVVVGWALSWESDWWALGRGERPEGGGGCCILGVGVGVGLKF